MDATEIRRKYRLKYDLHTHTTYSCAGPYLHATGSILENVAAGVALGLETIAITDHGPHEVYGMRIKQIPKMRQEIEEAKALYPGIEVLLGVEADIVDTPNGTDLLDEEFELFDFVNAGYHYGTPHSKMLRNFMSGRGIVSQSEIEKLREFNTEIALRALHNNNIKVLTHPGDKAPFDMVELCKACESTGTLMEINAKHKHMTVDEIKLASGYDVSFIIGSDAHKPGQVGRYVSSVAKAIEAGLDLSRIVNLEERK